MSIMDATPEEIRAMQERISRRQSDRRYQMEMDQAVALVSNAHNRRPTQTAPAVKLPSRESAIVATGTAAIAGAAALLGSTGAIPMGYAAAVTGAALAGAVGEIVKNL